MPFVKVYQCELTHQIRVTLEVSDIVGELGNKDLLINPIDEMPCSIGHRETEPHTMLKGIVEISVTAVRDGPKMIEKEAFGKARTLFQIK